MTMAVPLILIVMLIAALSIYGVNAYLAVSGCAGDRGKLYFAFFAAAESFFFFSVESLSEKYDVSVDDMRRIVAYQSCALAEFLVIGACLVYGATLITSRP